MRASAVRTAHAHAHCACNNLVPQIAERDARHSLVREGDAQELLELVRVLGGVEVGDGEIGDVHGQLHLLEHVEPMLDRRSVYLARKVGSDADAADRHVAVAAHLPYEVVVGLGVRERLRGEHLALVGRQHGAADGAVAEVLPVLPRRLTAGGQRLCPLVVGDPYTRPGLARACADAAETCRCLRLGKVVERVREGRVDRRGARPAPGPVDAADASGAAEPNFRMGNARSFERRIVRVKIRLHRRARGVYKLKCFASEFSSY